MCAFGGKRQARLFFKYLEGCMLRQLTNVDYMPCSGNAIEIYACSGILSICMKS